MVSLDCHIRHAFGAFTLDVAFETAGSGVTALFGHSGAGKTTVVNAIAGLFRPQEGRIVIGGDTIFDSAAGIFTPPDRRGAATVFQDARLFAHMRVRDNLLFGWRRSKHRASAQEIDRVFSLLGVSPLLDRWPAKLSGGEKSRVALGRALLASPRLLLLDEPLAALDVARKAEILPYLERLRDEANVPMIYVTHSLDEVARLADRVIVLDNGKVARQGSVFDLMPLLDEGAYGAILATKIREHRSDGLTVLDFDGGTLFIPAMAKAPGSRLRVRLRAEDVMLAREEPRAISANNILPVTVAGIRATGPSHADVRLACGHVQITARITKTSLARLAIAEGQNLFAIVKSVTIDPQRVPQED